MSEAKHTPGPWTVDSSGPAFRVEAGGLVLAEVFGVALTPRPATEEANARLIAAAPELLEALEELVSEAEQSAFEQWVERVSPSGDADFVQHQWNVSYDRDEFLGLYEKQIAAIAKAKGESTC